MPIRGSRPSMPALSLDQVQRLIVFDSYDNVLFVAGPLILRQGLGGGRLLAVLFPPNWESFGPFGGNQLPVQQRFLRYCGVLQCFFMHPMEAVW